MSQDTENKQCQICKGYLFEDDDIVICPVCGAPHHRDCWQSVGHCGLESDHGTDRQYDKAHAEQHNEEADKEAKVCSFCGRSSNSHEGNFCPYCGQPYNGANQHTRHSAGPHTFVGAMPFDENSYGGIPKDSKIEDVKVEHAAKFVGSNAHRYIPRFATLNKHNKGSWNWAAFLSPEAWCFSRKMYLPGLLFLIISLASGLCLYPFEREYATLLSEQEVGYAGYSFIMQNIGSFRLSTLILMTVSVILNVAARIICGRMGDWLYRGFALDKVRKITSDPEIEDIDTALMRSGNLNVFAMLAVLLIASYAPSLIVSLL